MLHELALGWWAIVSRGSQTFQLASGLTFVMKDLALDFAYLLGILKIDTSAHLADFEVFRIHQIVVCLRVVLLS